MSIYRQQYTTALPKSAQVVGKGSQRFAVWKDSSNKKQKAKITKGKSGKDRITRRSAIYTVKYTDADGVVKTMSTKCRTKSAAQAVEANLRRQVELIKSGVLSKDEHRVSAHVSTPISNHIDAYLRHLQYIASDKRVQTVRRHLGIIAAGCDIDSLSDLNASKLEQWLLKKSTEENKSARTCNTYLASAKAFINWCIDDGRIISSPFSRIRKFDEKADCRHQRRALTAAEMIRLLKAARLRPMAEYGRETRSIALPAHSTKRTAWEYVSLTYADLDDAADKGRKKLEFNPKLRERLEKRGAERELVYKTLFMTGLRKGELASLTVGQLDLDNNPARAFLNPADEKNRVGNTIVIPDSLAIELREFLDRRINIIQIPSKSHKSHNTGGSDKLFYIASNLCGIFDADINVAGIPKRDARGRVVDVHALRHTFCSHLCKAGVPLRTAQAAMRHSDPRLTANIYSDPALLDLAGAVNQLPDLSTGKNKIFAQGSGVGVAEGTTGKAFAEI